MYIYASLYYIEPYLRSMVHNGVFRLFLMDADSIYMDHDSDADMYMDQDADENEKTDDKDVMSPNYRTRSYAKWACNLKRGNGTWPGSDLG